VPGLFGFVVVPKLGEVALRVVVVVDPVLPGVELARGNPFGGAVAAAGGPFGLLDELVVEAAGEGEFVDVGAKAPRSPRLTPQLSA
jgi:hypothetical protein